jgi:hypothetical protein
MSSIPNKPTTTSLSHQQCIDLLSRIQEACFLQLRLVNDSSPAYVWTNEKPRIDAYGVATSVASALMEAGLNPKD